METVKCNSKEEAIKMLQKVKEFLQSNVEGKNDPSVIASKLSFIDAVQLYLDPEYKFK